MVTRDEVVRAYGALLERDPEDDSAIEHHLQFGSFPDLCAAIISSDEFQNRFARKFGVGRNPLNISDLDHAVAAFERGDKHSFAGVNLRLPAWYSLGHSPETEDYRDQIMRLWREITQREHYSPSVDEETPEMASADVIRSPGFYGAGDAHFSGEHLSAMGHILMRSGIGRGAVALEYGAGCGLAALAFAQTGVNVHTVDVSSAFTGFVSRLAAHHGASITAHKAEFGFNPLGQDGAYDLIYFYESFHHCLEFQKVIPKLRKMLKPGGSVLLAGEPIFDEQCEGMPYPWGIRLDWENVAIMRIRGWMELGFQRDYLVEEFAKAGFRHEYFPDERTGFAKIYKFTAVD